MSVLIIYSLILLVKNKYSNSSNNIERRNQEDRILCHNCQLIYRNLHASKSIDGKCIKCGGALGGATQINGKVSPPKVEKEVDEDEVTATVVVDIGAVTARESGARQVGTGVAFEPETVSVASTTTDGNSELDEVAEPESGSEAELEKQRAPRGAKLEPQLSQHSTLASSIQTVLEVKQPSSEAPVSHSETAEEAAAGEAGQQPRYRWINSVGRVLRGRRMVDMLRQAVSGGGFSSARDEFYFDASSSSGCANSPNEPEFLSSNRLRSADIQM